MTRREREDDFEARWAAAGATEDERAALAESVAREAAQDRSRTRIVATWRSAEARARANRRDRRGELRIAFGGALVGAMGMAAVMLFFWTVRGPESTPIAEVKQEVAEPAKVATVPENKVIVREQPSDRWATPERRTFARGRMELAKGTVLAELAPTSFRLDSGAIRVALPAAVEGTTLVAIVAGDLRLETPAAIFAVRVDGGRGAVRVFDGKVKVTDAAGTTRELDASTSAKVTDAPEAKLDAAWGEAERARASGERASTEHAGEDRASAASAERVSAEPVALGAPDERARGAGRVRRALAAPRSEAVRASKNGRGAERPERDGASDALGTSASAARRNTATTRGSVEVEGVTSKTSREGSTSARSTDVSASGSTTEDTPAIPARPQLEPATREPTVVADRVERRASSETSERARAATRGIEPTSVRGVAKDELLAYRAALKQLRSGDASGAARGFANYLAHYPKGALREEAELSRFEALSAAGDHDALTHEATAWLAAHPQHPRAVEVRALVGGTHD